MIIYLDMDGVIADFFGGLAKRCHVAHWKDIMDIQSILEEIRGTTFFNELLEFDTTMRLIDSVRSIADRTGNEWGICSSPLRGDRDNSAHWKRNWLEVHGYMPKVKNLVFTRSKEKYAINSIDGTGNILIDDKPDNINRWEDKGGKGLLYQANKDDVADLIYNLYKFTPNNKEG